MISYVGQITKELQDNDFLKNWDPNKKKAILLAVSRTNDHGATSLKVKDY